MSGISKGAVVGGGDKNPGAFGFPESYSSWGNATCVDGSNGTFTCPSASTQRILPIVRRLENICALTIRCKRLDLI